MLFLFCPCFVSEVRGTFLHLEFEGMKTEFQNVSERKLF